MKIITCQSFKEADEKACQALKVIIKEIKKPALNIFLPTGRTPRGLYQLFREEKDFWSSKIAPIQIDEFVDPKRIFLRS